MQNTSANFKEIFRSMLREIDVRVDIAGVQYLRDSIVSLSTSGGAFSEPDIGSCTSRQIDLEIYPKGDIPRQAQMNVYARPMIGERAGEWIPQGVFFISTRQQNEITGTLMIHGFDAMLKAGAIWEISGEEYFPMPQREAVEDIASRMGVEIDARTRLSDAFPVEYPVDENGDLTMIDILEFIAVADAGNWIMTDEGKLLLLRYGDIPPETNYLVTEWGDNIVIGGVKLLVG